MNVLMAAAQARFREGTEVAWDRVTRELKATPDEGTCILVLNTAAHHGLPDLAANAIAALDYIGVTKEEHHFAALVDAFVVAGSIKEALATLAFMRTHGVAPGPQTARRAVAAMAADVSKADDGFNLLYDLHSDGRGVDVAAVNAVLSAAVELGDLNRAVGVYKSVGDWNVKPDVATYNMLLKGCMLKGHLELAERMFDEMKSAKVKPNASTYERLIRLHLNLDPYDEAFYYLEEMKQSGFVPPPSLYDALLRRCYDAQDHRSRLVLDEMASYQYPVSPALQDVMSTHKPSHAVQGTRRRDEKVDRLQSTIQQQHAFRAKQQEWYGTPPQ